MKGNGQRQWNQQHQLALGTTLLAVCTPGRVFACRWVSHIGAYGGVYRWGVCIRLIGGIWYKKLKYAPFL